MLSKDSAHSWAADDRAEAGYLGIPWGIKKDSQKKMDKIPVQARLCYRNCRRWKDNRIEDEQTAIFKPN